MKSAWKMIKSTVNDFMEDKALRLAAALAYYAIFSIGPLLVLIVGIVGLVMGEEAVRHALDRQLSGLLGQDSAKMVESMMKSRSGSGLVATIIGGVALLFGASGVFGQLQDALNTVWEVRAKPGQGIMGFIRQRFLSMAMVLGIGFLLLVSMVLSTALSAFSGYLSSAMSVPEWVSHGLDFVVALAVITLLFAAIFKVLPDVEIAWRDVWVGAFGTALLFTLGKFLLAMYLGRESTRSGFGMGAAVIVVIMYIYYASVILFFGAEFTQVYARARGAAIRPSEHAEPLTDRAKAQQGQGRKHSGSPQREQGRHRPAWQPAYASKAMGGASADTLEQPTTDMSTKVEYSSAVVPLRVRRAPLEQIKAQPASYLVMLASAGVAAGLLLKFRNVRRLFKLYTLVRRFL